MTRFKPALVFVCSMFIAACSEGGGDGSVTTPDAAVSQVTCGDGVCAANEVGYCTQDCGGGSGSGSGSGSGTTCGNFVCEAGETAASCPNDCSGGGGGSGSGSGSANCPSDTTACFGCVLDPSLCPAGLDADTCLQCALGGLGGGGLPTGGACNNDGTCDATEMLDPTCGDCV